jgi:hypothetical protein
MARRAPRPRRSSYYGMAISGTTYPDGTWLEDEAFAYPAGGFTRRALASFPDGSRRVVQCSIPDTYFSIPARARVKGKTIRGSLSWPRDETSGVIFTPHS